VCTGALQGDGGYLEILEAITLSAHFGLLCLVNVRRQVRW